MAIYRKKLGPAGAVVVILLSIGFLGGSVHEYFKTRDFLASALHAKGQVVEIKQRLETTTRHRNGVAYQDKHMMYNPVVTFRDAKNGQFSFADGYSSSTIQYTVGQAVEVIYTESDPQATATIDHGALNWMFPGVLALMGVAGICAGALAFRRGA